jgi:hypothetical protein
LFRVVGASTYTVVDIDLSGRAVVEQMILAGSITLDKLDPDIIIPQKNIGITSTGLMDDKYYSSTGMYLYQDLNRLRTEIREIKGLNHWEDNSETSLLDVNRRLTAGHRNGLFEYGDDLAIELITSTGLYSATSTGLEYIRIKTGKYIIDGKTVEIFNDQPVIALTDQDVYTREAALSNLKNET